MERIDILSILIQKYEYLWICIESTNSIHIKEFGNESYDGSKDDAMWLTIADRIL